MSRETVRMVREGRRPVASPVVVGTELDRDELLARIAVLEEQMEWRYGEKPPKNGHYNVRATGRLDSDGEWHIYVGVALVGSICHMEDIHWREYCPLEGG